MNNYYNNFSRSANAENNNHEDTMLIRETCQSGNSPSGGKPSGIHYLRYLIRKVWADRKLRFYLIVSIVIFKVILTLAIVFVIPQIAR